MLFATVISAALPILELIEKETRNDSVARPDVLRQKGPTTHFVLGLSMLIGHNMLFKHCFITAFNVRSEHLKHVT